MNDNDTEIEAHIRMASQTSSFDDCMSATGVLLPAVMQGMRDLRVIPIFIRSLVLADHANWNAVGVALSLFGPPAYSQLAAAVVARDPAIRRGAKYIVSTFGFPDAGALTALLEDESTAVRRGAATLLGSMGETSKETPGEIRHIDLLLQRLRDPEEAVAEAAFDALKSLRPKISSGWRSNGHAKELNEYDALSWCVWVSCC